MDQSPLGHEPVLLAEVLRYLAPSPGQVFVDCTVGLAGHAQALADRLGGSGLLIGLDVDPRNLELARKRLECAPCPVRLFHANFAQLSDVLKEAAVDAVHGLLADLGVSTNQLFDDAYGLSFAQAMPLDMRLDARIERSAADLVNRATAEELAHILFHLAQERYARRIAGKIVEARRLSPITTTERLAEIVRSAIPRRAGTPRRIDPATRTFLALRMHVNREMQNLAALLDSALQALTPGGKMAVISFQSTEDRLVKERFRRAQHAGLLRLLTRKPLCPSDDESARNPRSRSAKLRVAQKLPLEMP